MDGRYSQDGEQHLSVIDVSDNFTNWLYSEIEPFLQGDMLEVGSGLGTYSQKIVDKFSDNKIILSDVDSSYVQNLSKRFKGLSNVYVNKLDLSNLSDFKRLPHKVDTIFALNVLEHIEDDVSVLNNAYDVLKSGGRFVILVPAHKFLFCNLDSAVGHFRRYTKKDFEKKVAETKFKVGTMFYFDSLAMLGWYFNGKILKKTVIDEGVMKVFDALVPFLKLFDKYVLMKKIGTSLIVVLEKN